MTGKSTARKLANRILRENKKGRSYRIIAREDYPGVKHGTLNRFANEKGNYIPVEEEILTALGLKKARKPREWNEKRSIIDAMSQMIRSAFRKAKGIR